ncbi:MAG: hypothetical protein HKN47_00195, partial [Pirellulaceae bacterium]|nr:hypothetical protein [Pirellulaceae bacterium]
ATPMLSYDQTRTFVLDQWPIASRNLIGSRAMPRSSFHATLERMASRELNVGDVDDATSFLCTLRIDAEVFPDWRQLVTYPESARAESQPDDPLLGVNHFPIHVDRTTQAIHIFADQKWQPYSQWRDGNLAKLKRLTNWSR